MTAGHAPALHLSHVGLDLGGRTVLEDIDLVLEAGMPVAVAGPSGAGKTLLCLVIAGAFEPSRGSMQLETGTEVPGAIAPTGLVLQTHGLISGLTAEENVALPLQARNVRGDDVARRTSTALGDVGLSEHAARSVDELSGGERQRVGIARALAADPVVLVADEPTAELDPENRERVLRLLTGHARRGRIVVVASDDPEVIGACERTVELDGGRLVRDVASWPTPATGRSAR